MEIQKILQIKKVIELVASMAIVLVFLNTLQIFVLARTIDAHGQAFKVYHLKDFRSLNERCLGNGCMRDIGVKTI